MKTCRGTQGVKGGISAKAAFSETRGFASFAVCDLSFVICYFKKLLLPLDALSLQAASKGGRVIIHYQEQDMVEDLRRQASELYKERSGQEEIPTSDTLSIKKIIYVSFGILLLLA